jgi:acyl carrier protein
MTRREVLEILHALIVEIAPDAAASIEDAADATSLHDDIGLDSMDLLDLVERVAARTGVRVPEADFAELETLGRFVDYVAGISARAAASA